MEDAMTLNHIDLPVSDIVGAKTFFETYFGFGCVFEREDGLTVLLDESELALTLSPLPPGETCDIRQDFMSDSILRRRSN
jgi:hypothetical protein